MRFFLILSITLGASSGLFAQLLFNNTSHEEVYVALMQYESNRWKTTGWYRIEPLKTSTLVSKITNRYYYYYAYSKTLIWSGSDSQAWVHKTNAFNTFDGQEFSRAQGFKKVGLRKVDVNNSTTFTITLDIRTQFVKRTEEYFRQSPLDPMEGLYSISDETTIETTDALGEKVLTLEVKNHWAKVALVKDTVSLSRNYIEFVIEAEGFEEGDIKGEFLRTKQSPAIFMTDQLLKPEGPSKSAVLEYKQEEDLIEGTFEYTQADKKYTVKRSYLKYFPK